MPLVLLLLLMVACLWEDWPQFFTTVGLPASPALAAALTWGGVLLLTIAAAALARRTARHVQAIRITRAPCLPLSQGPLHSLPGSIDLRRIGAVRLGLGLGSAEPWPGRSRRRTDALPRRRGAACSCHASLTIVFSWFWFYDVEHACTSSGCPMSRHLFATGGSTCVFSSISACPASCAADLADDCPRCRARRPGHRARG